MIPEPHSSCEGADLSAPQDPSMGPSKPFHAASPPRQPCSCPCLNEGLLQRLPSKATGCISECRRAETRADDCLERAREEDDDEGHDDEEATRRDRLHAGCTARLPTDSAEGAAQGPEVGGREGVKSHAAPLVALLQQGTEDSGIATFFNLLLTEGDVTPGDCGVSLDDRPSWVDMERLRRGQTFAQKYFFGLVFSEMLSLFLLFSSPGSLQPLIFSGNSDTPFKAFQRYLSTVVRVASWYSCDLWAEGEARRNLRCVRRLHDSFRRRLNALRPAQTDEQRCDSTRVRPPLWTEGASDRVRQDFAHAANMCPLVDMRGGRVEWISQMEMSVTQMGFVALAVTFPDRFGAGGASNEELEGFVHLWRVIGHLLGVEERFNFCSEGLEGVRKRTKFLLRTVLAANMACVGAEWEHMTRCVLAGVNHYIEGITYEVSLLYLLETIGVDAQCVRSHMSARQLRTYRVVCFLLRWVMRVPPLRALINWSLRRSIKRAQNAPPEWLRARERKVYSYQQQTPSSEQ